MKLAIGGTIIGLDTNFSLHNLSWKKPLVAILLPQNVGSKS